MPDDSNGNYSLPNGYLAVTGQKVLPSNHNPPLEDIGTALTARYSRDGRAPMLGNVPMGGFLITNMGDGASDGDAVNKGQLDTKAGLEDDNTFSGVNTFTKTQVWSKGADVASAAALTLGDDGNYFDVTGNTGPIATIGTVGVGAVIKLHFDSNPTIKNSANIVLPGGADITVAPGDEAEFVEYAAGDWRCTNYQRAESAPYLHVRDQKASGVGGGTVSAGVQTRTLNTVVTNSLSGASLAANVVTLPAGTYDIEAFAPAYSVNTNRLILQVASGGAVLALGSNEYNNPSSTASTTARLAARITLATATLIELKQVFQSSSSNASAQGVPGSGTNPEVYAELYARKVA